MATPITASEVVGRLVVEVTVVVGRLVVVVGFTTDSGHGSLVLACLKF